MALVVHDPEHPDRVALGERLAGPGDRGLHLAGRGGGHGGGAAVVGDG